MSISDVFVVGIVVFMDMLRTRGLEKFHYDLTNFINIGDSIKIGFFDMYYLPIRLRTIHMGFGLNPEMDIVQCTVLKTNIV
jgi:hypothetical protein